MIILIDWKPERAIYAKVKDQKDKVTASGQVQSTWGIQLSKDLRLEASADQRLGTGAFKVVRENNGYCVQCTLPITFTIFPKFSKNPWSHALGRSPLNSSNLSLCPFIWNSHLFYLHNFFLKQKNFKIQNFFFTSLEKCEQQTHSLWTRE